jgi:hypothetical protein
MFGHVGGNLNEKNSFSGTLGTVEGFAPHDEFDAETGEIIEPESNMQNLHKAPKPNPALDPLVVADADSSDPAISREEVSPPGASSTNPPETANEPEAAVLIATDPLRSGSATREDAGAAASEPGTIIFERTPPEGVVWHEFLRCFPEHWGPALGDIKDSIRADGVKVPILRQGNVIIDGRARYLAARELGVEYPVQEYSADGDQLADIIALNMEARKPNLVERQSIAKKLQKLVPDRADEIADLLDLEQMREAAE